MTTGYRVAMRLWAAAGLALAASLLLPWFSGTSDGEPLTIAGWDTEPGFTAGMLVCALVIAVVRRPLIVALAAVVAIGLTIWMLPRGERYSGYDLGPGGFVALALALVVLGTAIRRSRLAGLEPRTSESGVACFGRRCSTKRDARAVDWVQVQVGVVYARIATPDNPTAHCGDRTRPRRRN